LRTPWNDADVCAKILETVEDRDSVCILSSSIYDPHEIKGLLGTCDLVISWRLHGAILSASGLVPTISLGYGTKVEQIFARMLGQERFYIHLPGMTPDAIYEDLELLVTKALHEKEDVRAQLRDRLPDIEKRASTVAEIASRLCIDSHARP
jgi:polysaccharide pyruvyl transferase WcaK-like protein